MKKVWENEKLICFEEKGIQYMQFKKLLNYPEITHCYTLRSNNEMDFPPSYKNNEKLQESYKKICDILNLKPQNVIKPHQTHTDIVKIVNEVPNSELPMEKLPMEKQELAMEKQELANVDGLITNKKELVLLTTSADCISMLYYDPEKKVIGSVHSGWKGTLAGICKNAVNTMITKYNCKAENIICCICPSIRQCCFEVDEDVKELFYEKYKDLEQISDIIKKGEIKEKKQKYLIDTAKINECLLTKMGLKQENIIDSNICTVCHSKEFHSYRVDKENSGRNAALISLN